MDEPFRSLLHRWQQGQQPDLLEFLSRVGPLAPLDLVAVLRIDQQQRWLLGQRLPAEHYLEAFPALARNEEAALGLIDAEFCLRRDQGESVSTEEFLQRFPRFAEQLQIHRGLGKDLMVAFPETETGPRPAPHTPRPPTNGPALWVSSPRVSPADRPAASAATPSQHSDPAGSTRMSRSPKQLPPTAVPAGRPTVPGYELLEELGRGGMGVVYKARQVRLNRIVALKMILSGGHAGNEERLRFLAEAEAIAAIAHPGIVQVHDFGTEANSPWFALEFCPGGSLASKLKDSTLPFAEAARLVEQIARAVQAAHDKGIIHRDLKPGNVLLTAEGQPRVTDFGLARRVEGDSGLTQTGDVRGTPAYMPPEQAQGQKVGPAADVYSLGAILYECLTGRPPFKAATPFDIIAQVISGDLVPPRSLVPSIPRDLETIALQALQKEASKRYRSAADLADDINRFLKHEPIRARRVPAWERAVKWARRRPTVAALVVAVVLALLGTSLGGVFYGLYKDQEAKELVRRQEFERLVSRAQAAEAVGRLAVERKQDNEAREQLEEAAQSLSGALALAEGDEEVRAEIEERQKAVKRDLEELSSRREMQPKMTRLLRDRDDVRFHEISPTGRDHAANVEKVRSLAPQALKRFGKRPPTEIAEALESDRQRFRSSSERKEAAESCYEVLLAWAEAEAESGLLPGKRPEDRVAAARSALGLLDVAETLRQAHHLTRPRVYHLRRAAYHHQSGNQKEAARDRARAEKQPPSTALDHFLSALEYYRQGKLDLAAAACGLALGEQTKHLWAQYLQALCQMKSQRWVEAKVGLTACLVQRQDFIWARMLRGAAHAEWGAVLEKAKDLRGAQQEFNAAETDFAQALAQARDPKTADPLAEYSVLTSRSVLWARQQRWQEASNDLAVAIRLRPDDAQAYANLAEVCRLRGDRQGAVRELTRALRCRPEDATLYHTRARIHQELGDTVRAQRDLEQVIRRKGASSERRASAYVELGVLKQRKGRLQEALEDFKAALAEQRNHPPAHRQRAETLLKLKRNKEAGEALDEYLKFGKPTAKDFLARGLIHSQLREYARALEAYNHSLLMEVDAETLAQRGWAYLQLASPSLALTDFDKSLTRRPKDASTLCGRGNARALLGQIKEAVQDGEEALKLDSKWNQELLVACIYARVAEFVRLSRRKTAPSRAEASYMDRAAELVCQATMRVKEDRRADYWRNHVLVEPVLSRILRHPDVARLGKTLMEEAEGKKRTPAVP